MTAEGLIGKSEGGKKERKKLFSVDSKEDEGTPESGVPLDTRQAIGELADCKSNETIQQVRYIKKYREAGFWDEICEAFDEALAGGFTIFQKANHANSCKLCMIG